MDDVPDCALSGVHCQKMRLKTQTPVGIVTRTGVYFTPRPGFRASYVFGLYYAAQNTRALIWRKIPQGTERRSKPLNGYA